MNKQELNKKLAEWAGFKWDGRGWHYPRVGEKAHVVYCPDLPNFTQSLDACFEWLVPKLKYVIISNWNKKKRPTVSVFDGEGTCFMESAETPALALCLAIEKLIDSET